MNRGGTMASYLVLLIASTLLSGAIVYKLVVQQFQRYIDQYIAEVLTAEVKRAVTQTVAEMLRDTPK